MAWNEPGGDNRDPWGGGKDKGPPDLDEVIRNLSKRLSGLLGGKGGDGGGGSQGSGSGTSMPSMPGAAPVILVAVVAFFGWMATGFYTVQEGTNGVELRFGKYSETKGSGLRWHMPSPFETREIVDISQVRSEEIGYRSSGRQNAFRSIPQEALMLTEDENIIDVRLNVQFQVNEPEDYLFNVLDPELTLRQATESALREAIGKSKMDFVLTEGRADIAAQVKETTQNIIDLYGTGLIITNINLQDAQPPEEVQAAFTDAIKAREDEQRLKNLAEAYSNEVIPKARGQAARRLEESEAYKAQIVAQAEGEADRFTQLLTEYAKAPEITRERLYLETMQDVLSSSSKIMMDVEGGNNLMYLPLDKIIEAGNRSESSRTSASQGLSSGGSGSVELIDSRSRSTTRSRETLQ